MYCVRTIFYKPSTKQSLILKEKYFTHASDNTRNAKDAEDI